MYKTDNYIFFERSLKKILLIFFSIFWFQTIYSQSEIDSLETLFNKYTIEGKRDSSTISLIKLLYNNYKISKPDQAIEYATIALKISVEINDTLQTALINRMIGDVYFNQKIYFLALKSYYEALKIFDKIKNKNEYAYSLVDVAYTHYVEQISDKYAINYYLEAIKIFTNINDFNGLAKTYNLIALVYSRENKYDEATNYLIKSLTICHKNNCQELEAQAYIDLSEINKNQQKYQTALQYLDSAYIIYERKNISFGIVNFLRANIYFANKDYNNSIKFFNIALKDYQKLEDKINIAEVYNYLANIYFEQQQYSKAIENAQIALNIANNNYYLPAIQNSYFLLSKIYSETGDLDLALRSFNLYSEMKDSIFALKNADRYTDLTVSIKTLSYENEKKILESDKQIQELKNKKQSNIIFLVVILAVFFLIILIVLYSRYTYKIKSEKRLLDLANASVEGIAIHDKGILVEVNDKLTELIGYNREELLGKNILKLIAIKDKSKMQETFYETQNVTLEILHSRKDKTEFLAEISSRIFVYKNINMKVVSIKDITEQKLAQKRITETELKFKTLVETSPDGMVIINKLGEIEFASNTFLKLFEIKTNERVLGKNITNFFDKEYVAKINVDIQNMINNLYHGVSEYKALKKSNSDFYVECNGEVLKDVDNNITSVFLIIRDITYKKIAEENLKKYANNLQLSNNTKDKMFSIIAHDLRGPIGNLKAMMELLVENPEAFETMEIKDILTSLKDSSVSTFELLENLLNWAKSQQGLIHYIPNNYDIREIVNDAIDSLKPNIINKNINIKNNFSKLILVTCDTNMIKTVLRNLISNAIKFTHAGGEIVVDYQITDKNIIVYIRDNGIGINDENINKLFKNTEYFTTFGTNKEKGSGLGLNLCKEFVEKNEGKIWVVSKVNEGTTFLFSLKLVAT